MFLRSVVSKRAPNSDGSEMNLACVFPGQGSQAVGMLCGLAKSSPVIRETFTEASDYLGRDLWSLAAAGPEEELNRTENTQPVMLAAGVAVWRAWRAAHGEHSKLMAGHSLGEYTALVCAGKLMFSEAVLLVQARARAMQTAVPEGEGAMAAILGLEDEQVVELCARAAEDQTVSPVNFNAPAQIVIAGNTAAVERAMKLANLFGAKRVMRLSVSVPAHSALMKPAAKGFAAQIAQTRIALTEIVVLHNVDAASHNSVDDIRDALVRQMYSPVRWVQTVRALAAEGIGTILEMGPGRVLTGLNKRIDKSLQCLSIFDPVSLKQALSRSSHMGRAPA